MIGFYVEESNNKKHKENDNLFRSLLTEGSLTFTKKGSPYIGMQYSILPSLSIHSRLSHPSYLHIEETPSSSISSVISSPIYPFFFIPSPLSSPFSTNRERVRGREVEKCFKFPFLLEANVSSL